MQRSRSLPLAVLAAVCLAVQLPTVDAAIVISGDVDPADAGSWSIDTDVLVGKTANGELEVNGGSSLDSRTSYIGFEDTATGVVTVDGADSAWTNSANLYIGCGGNGTLNISGGAEISVTGSAYVAYQAASTGLIHFDAGGGTLTTGSLLASPTQLVGTGTVNTRSLVSDIDLLLDSAASLTQTFVFDSQPERNVTVNLDMASSPSRNGVLGAGWKGRGSLAIRDGVTVTSLDGYIGYHSGSTGVVTVHGADSTWTNRYGLFVGRFGSGALNISSGAAVSNDRSGQIGLFSDSMGVVTVDGAGSTWINGGNLYIGREGSGALNLTGGAAVSNDQSGYIGANASSMGVVKLDGAGSTWTNSHDLHVGSSGSGTLNITDGAAVSNAVGYIGASSGSTGDVTVDGGGSTWLNSRILYVGNSGSGTLNITGGAEVSTVSGYIGRYSGSTGVVTVDGADSTWNNSDNLYVGYQGTAALNITNGGAVSAASVSVNSESLLVVDSILDANSAAVAGTLAGKGYGQRRPEQCRYGLRHRCPRWRWHRYLDDGHRHHGIEGRRDC